MINISIMINQLFDKNFQVPVESQIERAARVGFKHQDISFWDWAFYPQSPFRSHRWEEWIDGITGFIKDRNIIFNQAHAPASIMPAHQSLLDEMYMRTIKASALLGVKWIVFHVHEYPGICDKMYTKDLKEKNIKVFGKLLEAAEKLKVGIALENMHSRDGRSIEEKTERYCSRTEELVELVDSFKSEYIGVCWDIGHGNLVYNDQSSIIKSLGKRIKALHVHDNNGLADQHLVPFHGNIDWKAVIMSLYDIGYDGDFNFEASLYLDKMPDVCKDLSLKLLYEIGIYILNMAEV